MKDFTFVFIFSFLTFISLSYSYFSCKLVSNNSLHSTAEKFNKDSAYVFIEKQVEFGARVPNTQPHKRCYKYLSNKLKNHGAQVTVQEFSTKAYTGRILEGYNIIGQFNPLRKRRILLAAHWDTRFIADKDIEKEKRREPVLGADDGASGVGILMEIARLLSIYPMENIGIDIIFFDAEDQGEQENKKSWCLGSQYWTKNIHVSSYHAEFGILLDMVGGKNPRFQIERYSEEYAPEIIKKVWGLANNIGFGDFFLSQVVGGIIDDHLYINEKTNIPMINIINIPYKENHKLVKYWHTTYDTMDNIDKNTLDMIGRVVLSVIYNEDNKIIF